MATKRDDLEARLKRIGDELNDVRRDLRDVTRRGREAIRKAHRRRDEGLIASIRRQLGL